MLNNLFLQNTHKEEMKVEWSVFKQRVYALQKEIEELKDDLRYEVAATRRTGGMFTREQWTVGSAEWLRLDDYDKDRILRFMYPSI